MAGINSLQDLYVNKLQMIYDAEQQALQAMPQLTQLVSNPELRQGFEMHRRQTEEQVRRLDEIFQLIGQGAPPVPCVSMRALIEEGQQLVGSVQDADTRDALLIASQQAIEHHEIAAYGTVRTWARQLGREQEAQLLQQTLQEEEQTDKLLTQIAEGMVNQQAVQGDRDVTAAAQRDGLTQGTSGATVTGSRTRTGGAEASA